MEALFDESRRPLLEVRFPAPLSNAEFDAYLERLSDWMRRGSYALVVDGSDGVVPSLEQQRRQARQMHQMRPYIERNSRGTAFVVAGPAGRFALSAIFAIARMPGLYTVVADLEEGRTWCLKQLQRVER